MAKLSQSKAKANGSNGFNGWIKKWVGRLLTLWQRTKNSTDNKTDTTDGEKEKETDKEKEVCGVWCVVWCVVCGVWWVVLF